jgi:Flp pilus assembly protein TadG
MILKPQNKTGSRLQTLGRSRRNRRGTEVLEAAFTFLPLMWLTFGAVDFGYYFYVQHNVQGAVREAARAGCVPTGGGLGTNAAMQTAANNVLTACGLGTCNINGNCEGLASGTPFTVTMDYPYTAMGVPPARVPKTAVRGTMVMMKE